MARIRMVKVRGKKGNKPKVVYMHNSNFDRYTSSKNGKYNVVAVGKQKSSFVTNQIKTYSATVRFHA